MQVLSKALFALPKAARNLGTAVRQFCCIVIRRFVEATTLCCSTRNCAMLPKELSLLRTRLIDSLLVQISPSAFPGLEIFRKLRNVMQIVFLVLIPIRLDKLLTGARDATEFLDWQKSMRQKDRDVELAEAEQRKVKGKLSHEDAILARQNQVKSNQEKVSVAVAQLGMRRALRKNLCRVLTHQRCTAGYVVKSRKGGRFFHLNRNLCRLILLQGFRLPSLVKDLTLMRIKLEASTATYFQKFYICCSVHLLIMNLTFGMNKAVAYCITPTLEKFVDRGFIPSISVSKKISLRRSVVLNFWKTFTKKIYELSGFVRFPHIQAPRQPFIVKAGMI